MQEAAASHPTWHSVGMLGKMKLVLLPVMVSRSSAGLDSLTTSLTSTINAALGGANLDGFATSLKGMTFSAAWGAANERKYGKDMGSWDHLHFKATTNFDAVREGIDDDSVSNLINSISNNAAWGAANERAWGKRSDSQVDWDVFKHDGGKLEGRLRNDDLANALSKAAFHAAWWAANSETRGMKNYDEDAKRDHEDFERWMRKAGELAPRAWPMDEIRELLKNNAFAASSHRAVSMADKARSFMTGDGSNKENRKDWVEFEKNAQALKKFLGVEQKDLYEQLENMVLFAAWGAVNQRWDGKRNNNAKVNWEKFNFHADAGQALYKGPADWNDVKEMITGASWGAANERAYGQQSEDARSAWRRFEQHAAKVMEAGKKEREL